MTPDLTPLLALARQLRATLGRDDDPVAVIQRARAEVLDLIDAIREVRQGAGTPSCRWCSGIGYLWLPGQNLTVPCGTCHGTGKAG
jgi:hypothetical protein